MSDWDLIVRKTRLGDMGRMTLEEYTLALEAALRDIAADHEPGLVWCENCGNKPRNCLAAIARLTLKGRPK